MAEEKDNKKDKKDLKKFTDFDPTKFVELNPTLKEAEGKTVAFTFGRMNPPTVGHEKLVKKVQEVANAKNAEAQIYLSHTQNDKKDPLDYQTKIQLVQKAFGPIVKNSKSKTIIQVVQELEKNGFSDIILVVGSDRVKEFKVLLNKYNRKDYTFNSISVVSAGERDPDAEGVEGMSASKLRSLAVEGNFETFKSGLPRKIQKEAQKIYDMIRKNIKEELNEVLKVSDGLGAWIKDFQKSDAPQFKNADKEKRRDMAIAAFVDAGGKLDEALTRQQRMKRARIMRRLKSKIKRGRERASRRRASMDTLRKRSRKAARNIIKKKFTKGKDYGQMSYGQRQAIDDRLKKVSGNRLDNLAKRLLPKVRKKEMERMKKRSQKKEEVEMNEASPTKYSWNDVNKALTKSNYMRGNSSDIMKVGNSFKFKSGTDKNFSTKDVQKNLSKAGIQPAKIHDIMVKLEESKKSQDSDVKDLPGSQPKGYYKGVDKKDKEARAKQFARQAKMDDDDPRAYKPAPGDKEAKTKPSKHTNKFKQMFGELVKEASRADQKVRKRPHMMLKAGNTGVKFDGRFKMFKKKPEELEESVIDILAETYDLMESVEAIYESNPEKALKKKAEKSGMPYGVLKKVYDRGVAAWRTGHRPGTTPSQWGLARVNSFATKGKGTWGKADADLAAKVRGEEFVSESIAEITETDTIIVAEILKAKKHNTDEYLLDFVKDYLKRASDKDIEKLGKAIGKKITFQGKNVVFEKSGAGEWGTDELTKTYKKDTPGQ